MLSPSQVRYICRTNNEGEATGAEDDTDALYKFLEASNYSYVSLLEKIKESTGEEPARNILLNESKICASPPRTQELNILGTDQDDAIKVTSTHRNEMRIQDDQEMLVGIAYSIPSEVKQFRLFPAVVHIDATADSNKEGRPLSVKGTLPFCAYQTI